MSASEESFSYLRGWVLAGGASSRMGEEKSALLFGKHSLLHIAVDKVRSLCGNATVLCGSNPERAMGIAEAVGDLRPPCGPLGGIEAALQHTDAEWNFFLAVDTPLIPPSLLRSWIKEALSKSGAGGAVLLDHGRVHALPLLLHRDTLSHIRASLDAGEYKLIQSTEASVAACGLFMSVTNVDDLISDPSELCSEERSAWFANVNTPDELERMRRFTP